MVLNPYFDTDYQPVVSTYQTQAPSSEAYRLTFPLLGYFNGPLPTGFSPSTSSHLTQCPIIANHRYQNTSPPTRTSHLHSPGVEGEVELGQLFVPAPVAFMPSSFKASGCPWITHYYSTLVAHTHLIPTREDLLPRAASLQVTAVSPILDIFSP